jgi:AbrB family looped-hinge helix DNA binding protein
MEQKIVKIDIVKMDKRGRITIPKSIRKHLEYDLYKVILDGNTIILKPVKVEEVR